MERLHTVTNAYKVQRHFYFILKDFNLDILLEKSLESQGKDLQQDIFTQLQNTATGGKTLSQKSHCRKHQSILSEIKPFEIGSTLSPNSALTES